jgi:hypothetical protein
VSPHLSRRARAARAAATPLIGLAVAVGALTGCGGQGSDTSCGVNGCTVTFNRNGTAEVSVLGVSARLVGVDQGVARIEVAGQTVEVPVGGQAEVGGFTVQVEEANDTQVVVRIAA